MRHALVALCALTMMAAPALADPDKDESGKGRWGNRGQHEYNFDRGRDRGYDRYYSRDRDYDRGRRSYNMERKQEFWDGNCKIERKWERNGEYKEERKCKGGYRY